MTPIRVLIVDDDALLRDLVARALPAAEFEVAAVSSAAEIADATKAFVPDVVLVDVNLPGSSSGGAAQVVRGFVPPDARVILFSADDEAVLRAIARRVGADGWVSKGASVLDLGARIRKLLGR
jgi:DNA-binding response OmpR family regulator